MLDQKKTFLRRSFLAVLFGFGLASSAPKLTAAQTASAIPTQIPGQDAILMGVAWYPEQWPESRWEEDLRLMEAAQSESRADRRICLEPHGTFGGPL